MQLQVWTLRRPLMCSECRWIAPSYPLGRLSRSWPIAGLRYQSSPYPFPSDGGRASPPPVLSGWKKSETAIVRHDIFQEVQPATFLSSEMDGCLRLWKQFVCQDSKRGWPFLAILAPNESQPLWPRKKPGTPKTTDYSKAVEHIWK